MSDIIQLLPDHIANQIAAGEVVQRPASVVKELIENSIDAGATKIELLVKDGGKTLVQVVDNGCGMTEGDARMCFERHATSKIKAADDLFKLRTKGFRGEALASIAAIAHVDLKTKQVGEELGTAVIIEGSKVIEQKPSACVEGTSIAVKNLFYNVPARRNFLGSDITEYRKVLDEFLRIALVHPNLTLSFKHNNELIYQLHPQNLRQRLVNIYGKPYNERLVAVEEETDIVKITGFISKPEFARSKSDQSFLFVNDRFFKDRYFHHAIMAAYDGIIPQSKYPPYFLYFSVPTESIDVNVHPTKTEIKFEENQAIYAIIRSAIKQALGKFNVAPTLDFEHESTFDVPPLKEGESIQVPQIKVNPDYNPFNSEKKSYSGSASSGGSGGSYTIQSKGFSSIQPNKEEWEDEPIKKETQVEVVASSMNDEVEIEKKKPVQINNKYILTSVKNGFLLIDQYRAHCRVLFEKFLGGSEEKSTVNSQKLLFTESFEIDSTEKPFWSELLPHLNENGFELSLKGKEIMIDAVPVDAKDENPVKLVQSVLDQFKESEQLEEVDLQKRIALSLAASLAIKGGKRLGVDEMEFLIDALFASEMPQISPHGKKIIETFTLDEITKRFN